MRYADRYGNIIDVYQATTQMPDEDPWDYARYLLCWTMLWVPRDTTVRLP